MCTAVVDLIKAVQPALEQRGIMVLHTPFLVFDLLDVRACALTAHTSAQSNAAQERSPPRHVDPTAADELLGHANARLCQKRTQIAT